MYLGNIEAQLLAALEEGRSRLAAYRDAGMETIDRDDVPTWLRGKGNIKGQGTSSLDKPAQEAYALTARQIVGQPAGAGLATGKACVISRPSDLAEFKRGEVLVCDAIDPGMTFVIPLAAAVVERRGGMLIHGAIIAREYGLPCVTGVPDATRWIKTGDTITVDGYLGMVIIGGPLPGK